MASENGSEAEDTKDSDNDTENDHPKNTQLPPPPSPLPIFSLLALNFSCSYWLVVAAELAPIALSFPTLVPD